MGKRPIKYKNYEEAFILSEIRRFRIAGHPDKAIIGFLDMPERTFYDYVKRMYELTAELAKELREHDKELLREQLEIYKARANNKLRELDEIIAKKDGDERNKIEAVKAYDHIALNIVTIQYEKPEILGESLNDNKQTTNNETQKATATS